MNITKQTAGSPANPSIQDCEIEQGTVNDCAELHDPLRQEFYPEGEF